MWFNKQAEDTPRFINLALATEITVAKPEGEENVKANVCATCEKKIKVYTVVAIYRDDEYILKTFPVESETRAADNAAAEAAADFAHTILHQMGHGFTTFRDPKPQNNPNAVKQS